MNNNDILRRIRYTFDIKDSKMISIFKLGDKEVTRTEISDWLKQDEDPDFKPISDKFLATFLNGLINEKRGKKEGAQPILEQRLTNNIILRKLKIALNFKDHEMLEILDLAEFPLGKHELSAFFRKPEQSQYRLCRDQVLRRFLQGLAIHYRGDEPSEQAE